MNVGPCAPWPVEWCVNITGQSPAATGLAVQAATDVLWALSGRQFGECVVPLRPCRENCDLPSLAYTFDQWWTSTWPMPYLDRGLWYNLGCGGCGGSSCFCNTVSQITLPGPIASIESVVIDGAVLDPGAYRLDDRRWLVRTDGGEWPECNGPAVSGVGTWVVNAVYGAEVPVAGRFAVGELAAEILKACACDDGCRLPSRVQSIVRQNVQLTFYDPNLLLTEGRLGLPMCDTFILAVNPNKLHGRPRVYSPDVEWPRR